jgi:type 1 glutamine amidotransferase
VRVAFAIAAALACIVPIAAHAAPGRLLVFSKTDGFRHDSIAPAIAALQAIAPAREWTITATEDAAVFEPGTLAQIDVVVFLMTTGDVLDDAQQTAMQAFVDAGGGFVGVHSATDTEYDWPWYGELVGARFVGHPAPQDATVNVVAIDHPACAGLPAAWSRFDEWYNFDASPSATSTVLLQLDETSYEGGTMGADHPIAWVREIGDARMFYTGGGHTNESWAEPLWIDHVANGIDWVIGDPPTMGDTSTGGESSEGGQGESSSSTSDATTSTTATTTTSTTSTTSSTTTGDDTTGAPTQDDHDASGCGCHTRPQSSLLLLLAPLLARRRRGACG